MSNKKFGFWKAIDLSDPNTQLKNDNKRIQECETLLLKLEKNGINEWSEDLLSKISKYKEKYMKKEEQKK